MNNNTSLPPFTISMNNELFSIFNSVFSNNVTNIQNNSVSEEFKNNLEENIADEEFIKNQKQCSICLDDFKLGDKYIILPCSNKSEDNHVFHSGDEKCSGIKPWLERNNTCPMCRKEFPTDNQQILPNQDNNFQSFVTIHSSIISPSTPNPNNLENTISNIITNYINEIEESNEQRDIQLAIEASLQDNFSEDISND